MGAGFNFVNLLNEALSKSRYFLLLLSEESLNAEWPIAEQSAAIYSDPSGRIGRVIPILVRPCNIPPLLQYRTYINYIKKDIRELEKRKLISTIQRKPLKLNDIYKEEENSIYAELALETHKPDKINETIYSNLIKIDKINLDIWSAPTICNSRYDIRKKYNKEYPIPPYILKRNRIYTFINLSNENNVFSNLINNYDVFYESTIDWLEDKEMNNWLIELLNDAIRKHTEDYKMNYDKISNKYFFRIGVLRNRKISFKPHLRQASRSLIIERKRDDRILRYRHRAIKIRFMIMGKDIYLNLEPSVIFTYDGIRVIADRERQNILCTKFLSRQKNEVVFTEYRFWTWLLSEDGKKIQIDTEENLIEIKIKPVSTNLHVGILGDYHVIPDELDAPPELFEIDEEIEDVDWGSLEENFEEEEFDV